MNTTDLPAHLDGIDAARIVDLDVRDDLRAGREPFGRIMEARATLPPDGVLRLRAIFEPYPLYRVFEGQGLDHWTERLADDDWRVWFYRGDAGSEVASEAGDDLVGTAATPRTPVAEGQAVPEGGAATASAAEADEPSLPEGAVVLDVRGLEPPEPMVRTLAALEELDPADTLVQINERIPRFLLPQLEERGFAYHVRQQDPHLVRVFIRRKEAPVS